MPHVVLTVSVALAQLAAAPAAGRRWRASPGRSPQSVSGPPRATSSRSSRSDRMLYYGRGRYRAGDRVVPEGRGAAIRARRIPDGPALRLRIRRRAERRRGPRRGIAGPPSTAAPPRSARSATSTRKAAACLPTRPRPRAGTGAPPTATTSARSISSVSCTSTAPASRATTPSAYVWFSLAAGQAPLVDNRKGLLELSNIAAARMTPEAVAEAARRVAAWKPQRPASRLRRSDRAARSRTAANAARIVSTSRFRFPMTSRAAASACRPRSARRRSDTPPPAPSGR